MVRQTLADHHIYFKPAFKSGFDGRPINGMFVGIPLCLKEKTKDVSPSSDRIQAITLKDGCRNILILNTYFPTDPRSDNFDDTELLLLLSDISNIIERSQCDQIIWTGDMNTDFSRTTRFVCTVNEFISNLDLIKSWEKFPVDFTHTTERDGITYTSTIDHFIWNCTFGAGVIDSGVIHVPENLSDHCPIFCKFNLENSKECANIDTDKDEKIIFPSWNKLSDEHKSDFCAEIDWKLRKLKISTSLIECSNVHCKDINHRHQLDELMTDILATIEDGARKNMPCRKGNHKRTTIPNWKDEIEPYRENAHFWNAIWISAGKPLNCQLHTIMKKTRNRYHLLIRKKQRLLDRIKRDEMIDACLRNDTNIFDMMKKKRKCGNTVPTSIDGETDDIPRYLASKYEKLYSCVDDSENIKSLERELEVKITQEDVNFVHKIKPCVLKTCVRKLKHGKRDPIFKFSSDFLINSPDILFQLLSFCLKSYMTHSHVSDILLISSLVPIIKDKLGDITSSNNYRSIAISSLIMKLFDQVIINLFEENLYLDDLQFGYQSGVSTSMCTWLATESIGHFLRNGSEVFTCLMDMSKAFDMVQHSQLFKKLVDQGMPLIIVRFILVSYKNQMTNVRWNNEYSNYFQIKNGVKQGAVLSAVLYCVYTNGLFQELRKMKIGCFVKNTYVGVIGYADDLFLMSPSLDGLQDMLSICEKYAEKHNLKFSTDPNPVKSKTKCMAFLKKERSLRGLKLCQNILPWVDSGKHLGMKINNADGIFSRDIREKRARYIQGNNQLMQEFPFASCDTKLFLNKIYNGHHYGSVLWDLYDKQTEMVYNTWNVSIRNMLRLDKKTHRYLIEPLSNMKHLKRTFLESFNTFTEKLRSSRKESVRSVFDVISRDCRSTTGSNTRNIRLECECNSDRPLPGIDIEKICLFSSPPEANWKIPLIKELIGMRDELIENAGWTKEEITSTLDYLCTA